MLKEEYKIWYENVDFIQNNMQFYSFHDFIENCIEIKMLYSQMKRQGQKLFQWYLFAGSLSYKQKCTIWDYVNNLIDYPELIRRFYVNKRNKYYANMLEQRNDNKQTRT